MIYLCFAQKRNVKKKYFYTLFVIIIAHLILPRVLFLSLGSETSVMCVCDLAVIWEKTPHEVSYCLKRIQRCHTEKPVNALRYTPVFLLMSCLIEKGMLYMKESSLTLEKSFKKSNAKTQTEIIFESLNLVNISPSSQNSPG